MPYDIYIDRKLSIMNFKTLAFTALTALTLAAPATAGLRDQHFNPSLRPVAALDQCEAFEASADWIESRFNSSSDARVVKGNTVYLANRNARGCKGVYTIAELGQSFERGGYAGGTGEYHMEGGSLVFYSISDRYGRNRQVLSAQ